MFGYVASIVIANSIAHKGADSPYHWHMSCERFAEKTTEVMADENLPMSWRRKLLGYFKTKVEGDCDNKIV